MNDKEYIQSETNYLFDYNFNDDSIPEEIEEAHLDRATALLDNYQWNDIFKCWFEYKSKVA